MNRTVVRWLALPLALGLAAIVWKFASPWSEREAAGLKGQFRLHFITSTVESCRRQPAALPKNVGRTDAAVEQFCTCYANGFADRLRTDDVVSAARAISEKRIAQADVSKMWEDVAESVIAFCGGP